MARWSLKRLKEHGFDKSTSDRVGRLTVGCSQCAVSVINGTPCHEHDCPNWVRRNKLGQEVED
jgi:hypothetical protein